MKLQSFQDFLEEQVINETVSISDAGYQRTHGKKPSGTGNWMFSKHKNHDVSSHPMDDLFQHNGTYSTAKKAAVKHFEAKGHTGIIHTQS
jgi:arginine/lysine/ornithine decarboxylase